MEASLDDDIEHVFSAGSQRSNAESTTIHVTVNTTDGPTIQITVHCDEAIYEAVVRCLECDVGKIRYMQLGDTAVSIDGESFEEEDRGRGKPRRACYCTEFRGCGMW